MSAPSGAGVLAGAAALGLIVALADYLRPGSPINYSPGTLLVVVSTLILLVAAVVLMRWVRHGWLARLLSIGCLLDILGTGVAGWFLHAWVLVILMVIALAAWVGMSATARAEPAR